MASINVNMRPLNKGMVTNQPVNMVPKGAFLDVNGFIIKDGKLRLRPRFHAGKSYNYTSNYSTYGPTYDLMIYPQSSTDLLTFLLTENSILKDTGAAYTAESIPRAGTPTTTPLNYNSFTGVQWTLGRDADGPALWVTDGSNKILKYGGASPTWTEPVYTETIDEARSVLYHDSRLWVAGPTSSQGTMLRWSNLNDPDTFSATSFLYFPERPQPIKKLMTLGVYLVVYFSDAVYVGQPSGDPLLPYVFRAVEMTSVGLVGPKAVTPWKNGHIFISSQGVYWLRPDRVVEPVPCSVWDQIREEITRTDKYTLNTAGEHEDLYLGVPSSGYNISKLFYYNTLEQAWTYWRAEGDTLAISEPIATLVWTVGGNETTLPDGTEIDLWSDDLVTADTDWEEAGVQAWADLGQFVNQLTVVLLRDGQLYALSDSYTDDDWGLNGTAFNLTTGDLDFEEADTMKTFHKMRVRTALADGDHQVSLQGSIDAGRTWKNLGTFSLEDVDERWLNFRLTGAECRLRLTGNADVLPYDWYDLTFRVAGRGLETV